MCLKIRSISDEFKNEIYKWWNSYLKKIKFITLKFFPLFWFSKCKLENPYVYIEKWEKGRCHGKLDWHVSLYM